MFDETLGFMKHHHLLNEFKGRCKKIVDEEKLEFIELSPSNISKKYQRIDNFITFHIEHLTFLKRLKG